MAIEFPCTLCGKTLRIDDKFGGKMVQCPACKGKVNAPAAGAPPASPTSPAPQYPPPTPPQYATPIPPPPPPPTYPAPPPYPQQQYQAPPPQQYQAPPQYQAPQPQYPPPPQYQAPLANAPQGAPAYYNTPIPPPECLPPSKTQPLPVNVIFICIFSIVGGFFFQGWIFLHKGQALVPSDLKTWFFYIELLIYGTMCSALILGGVLLLERNALGWLLAFFGSLAAMIFGLGLSIFGAMTAVSGTVGVMEGFGNGLMFVGFPFVIWYSVKKPNFKGYFVRTPERAERRR